MGKDERSEDPSDFPIQGLPSPYLRVKRQFRESIVVRTCSDRKKLRLKIAKKDVEIDVLDSSVTRKISPEKLTGKLCEFVQVGLTQGGANEPKAQDWMLAWTVYLVIIISLLYLCVLCSTSV